MISILYAGGTISSKQSQEGYRVAESNVDLLSELRQAKPECSGVLDSLSCAEPVTIYEGVSENISELHLKLLSEKIKSTIEEQSPSGVLVTYGTDTMKQLAQYVSEYLNDFLEEKNIAIIITGANKDRHASDADVWDNLCFALESFKDVNTGVYVAFANVLIPANNVVIEPFDGKAMQYIDATSEEYTAKLKTFEDSRDALVEPFRVPMETGYERKAMLYSVNKTDIFNHNSLYQSVEALDTQIVIFVLYHSGTANVESTTASVSDLVEELVKMGITCFGASENGEPVDLTNYESSVKLREAGLIPLYNMDYMVAFEKAKYMLQLGVHPLKYIDAMYTDCYGEINTQLVNQEHKIELITKYETAMADAGKKA